MADLNEFLPALDIEFPEGKTAGKYAPMTVNGKVVKIVNGSDEDPEISQACLGVLQRFKDLEKMFPEARKKLVKIIADAIRDGVPISEGVRTAILKEKERETASYKDAFESLSSTWGEANFMTFSQGWGEPEFNKISAKWAEREEDIPDIRQDYLTQFSVGWDWREVARAAFLKDASPKAKGNMAEVARAAFLFTHGFSTSSKWDEIEVKVAK